MKSARIAASSLAAGALIMYFSDPDRGRRRRAMVRDRSVRTWNQFTGLLEKARRDATNRAKGSASYLQAVFRDRHADDSVLTQRVRSRLGRLVGRPHAVGVSCSSGQVTLSGTVRPQELDRVLSAVRMIPGVAGIESLLETHDTPEEGRAREPRSELMQQRWTPALRVTASAVGALLITDGFRRRGPIAAAEGLAGAAIISRALTNRELCEVAGIGAKTHSINVQRTVHLNARPAEVFRFISNFELLPKFMARLKEVRSLGEGKWHWIAEGPAGIPIGWDVQLTKSIPEKLLAWKNVSGSEIETSGEARLDPDPRGGTRLSIRLAYKPPAGILGHYVASLFGADPKSGLVQDLIRLKSLIEFGKTHAHGHRVDRDSLPFGPASAPDGSA
jgi:uncharacterized membrane protein